MITADVRKSTYLLKLIKLSASDIEAVYFSIVNTSDRYMVILFCIPCESPTPLLLKPLTVSISLIWILQNPHKLIC